MWYIKKCWQRERINNEWQDSSVGRAGDWKSPCPQFDSGTGHHFFSFFPKAKKTWSLKRLRFMARSAASYILMLDEQSSQAQNVLHVPQVRFINPPFQMKHCFTIVPQYEASSASLPIWSVPIGPFFDNPRQSNRLAFCFKFSVWRIRKTTDHHKAAKILRFAFPGDTAFTLKYA